MPVISCPVLAEQPGSPLMLLPRQVGAGVVRHTPYSVWTTDAVRQASCSVVFRFMVVLHTWEVGPGCADACHHQQLAVATTQCILQPECQLAVPAGNCNRTHKAQHYDGDCSQSLQPHIVARNDTTNDTMS